MSIIALDFDGTFTAMSWFCITPHFEAQGHQVITVTARRKTVENEREMRAAGVTWPIVFAYDRPKALAAKEAGYDLAKMIWIDDAPHVIGDGTENVAVVSVWERELRHAYDVLRTYNDETMPSRIHDLLTRLETVLEDQPTT